MSKSLITTRTVLHEGKEVAKGKVIVANEDDAAHLLKHGAALPIDADEIAALQALSPRDMTRDELIAYAEEKFGLTLVDANDPVLPNLARMKKAELIAEAASYGLTLDASETAEVFREAIAAEREKATS